MRTTRVSKTACKKVSKNVVQKYVLDIICKIQHFRQIHLCGNAPWALLLGPRRRHFAHTCVLHCRYFCTVFCTFFAHVFAHGFAYIFAHIVAHVFAHNFAHMFAHLFAHIFAQNFAHVFALICCSAACRHGCHIITYCLVANGCRRGVGRRSSQSFSNRSLSTVMSFYGWISLDMNMQTQGPSAEASCKSLRFPK
jgi:hypothetical protein